MGCQLIGCCPGLRYQQLLERHEVIESLGSRPFTAVRGRSRPFTADESAHGEMCRSDFGARTAFSLSGT